MGLKKNDNPLLKTLIESMEETAPVEKKKKSTISMDMTNPFPELSKKEMDAYQKKIENENPLVKSVLNLLNGPGQTIERLAFEQDPDQHNQYLSIYKTKIKLLSDDILKRIAIQDDLVASIVQARGSMMSSFGRPQPDRFSTGYKIEPMPGLIDKMSLDEKKALQKRIAKCESALLTCGTTNGWKDSESLDFGQFLYMSARDAVTFGRIATEVVYSGPENQKKFHSFRPIDAGTVYRAAPQKNQVSAVRKNALALLEKLKNKKLVPERFANDEYDWVQVIHTQPRQAFTAEECLVHNFYPTTNIELNGYPITPLDTAITAVLTHINIATHNKLYFQSGRAARGMVVIRSDDVDKQTVAAIRQQFNASINSVTNSWRMPIFGVGQDDEINWMPIDNSSRDMEFQYLSDSNARTILSAFQMSPDELPGWSHLSRGTNSQALSESNTEYLLTAHRDVGLRPMLAHFQNFINQKILPLIDPEISTLCSFKFVGLDAETAEKEAARIGAEVNLHLTLDEILEKVQKEPLGRTLGGKFPLNPSWQNAVAPYLHVGYIREHLFGIKDGSKDPEFAYVRDPMWFQWQQLQMQAQQMQQQAQQQQTQPGQPQEAQPQEGPKNPKKTQQEEPESELARSIDQAAGLLAKKEIQLRPAHKQVLDQQKKTIQHFLDGWEKDSKEAIAEIMATAKFFSTKKKQ